MTPDGAARQRNLVVDGSGHPKARPGAGVSASLVTSGRLAGHCCWIERRLFEVVGSWVADETDAEARVLFDILSRQFAWHGELWGERLPVLASVDRESLVVPPSPEVDELFRAVTPGGTLLRLVSLARVVIPRMVMSYRPLGSRMSPVADAPAMRMLEFLTIDHTEAWQLCESLVETLLHSHNDVDVVTAHQLRLETILAGVGPGFLTGF